MTATVQRNVHLMWLDKGMVPMLVPTVNGEVHNALTPDQYETHHAKHGDAFIQWVNPPGAVALEGR